MCSRLRCEARLVFGSHILRMEVEHPSQGWVMWTMLQVTSWGAFGKVSL